VSHTIEDATDREGHVRAYRDEIAAIKACAAKHKHRYSDALAVRVAMKSLSGPSGCFPKIATISAEACVSDATVKKVHRAWQAEGLLEITQKTGRSNHYRLTRATGHPSDSYTVAIRELQGDPISSIVLPSIDLPTFADGDEDEFKAARAEWFDKASALARDGTLANFRGGAVGRAWKASVPDVATARRALVALEYLAEYHAAWAATKTPKTPFAAHTILTDRMWESPPAMPPGVVRDTIASKIKKLETECAAQFNAIMRTGGKPMDNPDYAEKFNRLEALRAKRRGAA